jgi:hypothetical protein
MDVEFEKLKNLLSNIMIKNTVAHKHVEDIKRNILMIKERAWGTTNVPLYYMLPKLMIIKLMHFCVM